MAEHTPNQYRLYSKVGDRLRSTRRDRACASAFLQFLYRPRRCRITESNDKPFGAESVVCEPTRACGSPSCATSTDPLGAPLAVVRALMALRPFAGTTRLSTPTTAPVASRHVTVAVIGDAVVLRSSVNDA